MSASVTLTLAGKLASRVSMIPCTRRQLEVFLVAAEDCHFVSTAHRLGISQAAVSTHIAALENQLGSSLFVRRRGRKPILSSFGRELLREVHSYSTESAAGGSARCSTKEPYRQVVRVGAGGHLLDDYIKLHLGRFYKRHPDVVIECHYVDSPSDCVRLMREDSIDVLAYTVPNPATIPFEAEVLKAVKLGLYVGRRFASSLHASPAELSSLPFILPPEGSPACGLVQSALAAAGIDCRKVAAFVQFSTVAKDMAKRDEGVAVLFESMLRPDESHELLKLDVELATMYRSLFLASGAAGEAVESVQSFLRDVLSH